ncbi:MAG: hypothetical protein CMI75_07180 [Candidatus Pelagibacter sp.]|nr:hypothetical protein [Candidatus Pelagibacter sp.]
MAYFFWSFNFFFKKKNKLFYLFILIFILSEALIFISGDRSAFFYINLSAIFVILFSHNLLKLRLITLLSSLLLLVIISFINPTSKERVFDQTLKQMNLLDKDINQGNNQNKKNNQNKRNNQNKKNNENVNEKVFIFSKVHNDIYVAAYKMFLDNKVLGVGIKNFRNFCGYKNYKSELSCSTHPHNTYLQILTETGIFGFLFLIFVLIYFCKHVIKHIFYKFEKKQYFTDFEICLLSGIAIYLWPFIPTGSVFNNWLNIIMILNFPFLIWSRQLIKN